MTIVRAIAVALGVIIGICEFIIATVLVNSLLQFGHPPENVIGVALLILAGLCVPVLTIGGSLLGSRRPVFGGVLLIASSLLLFAFAGTSGYKIIVAELGTLLAGMLLSLNSLVGIRYRKPPSVLP